MNIDSRLYSQLWKVSPMATAAWLSADGPDPWKPARHLKIISDAIRDGVNGKGPRFLIINMPPRHGKSELSSKYAPVWFLGNWPHKRVMVCGYGQGFAEEWGGKVRNLVGANASRLGFDLAQDTKAKQAWHTTAGGAMYAAGIGGATTGKGANLLIIDDPVKNSEEAESSLQRDKIWAWWQTTSSTRIAANAVILVILTRWHEDDLAGRIMNPEYNPLHEQWREIVLPAICEDPKTDLLGRKVGEPLWPEGGFNLEELAIRRANSGDHWPALYQQKPRGKDGSGNVYEKYSDTQNVMRLDRDRESELFWALDFNRDPFSTIIGQVREFRTQFTHLTNEKLVQIEVLKELILHDASTQRACEAFVEETRPYVNAARGRLKLTIYGDVSGNHRSTTGDMTDWQIIRQFFNRYPEYLVTYRVNTTNPGVNARVTAVNEALCSLDGYRRLKIDPGCKELRKDFRQCRWMRDSNGNTLKAIDKRDAKRTHASDALGYAVYGLLALRPEAGEQRGLLQ